MRNHLIRAMLVVLLGCSTHALAGRASDTPGRDGIDRLTATLPPPPSLQPLDDHSRPWPAHDRSTVLEDEDDDDQRSPGHPDASRLFPGFAARISPARITTRPISSIPRARLRC